MKTKEEWLNEWYTITGEDISGFFDRMLRDTWQSATKAQMERDDMTVRLNEGVCPELIPSPFPGDPT